MKKYTLLLSLSLFVLCFAGCLSTSEEQSTTSQRRATKSRHYALIGAYTTLAFWSEPRNVWLSLSSRYPGVTTTFGGPTGGSPEKQIEEIESLLQQKVDGILIFPADPDALSPIISRAHRAGIPVITMFSDAKTADRVSCVRAIESVSARSLAERVLRDYPKLKEQKTKVIIALADPTMEVLQSRLAGIREVFSSYPHIEIVATVRDDNDEQKAAEAISAAMVRHPDVALIIGIDARAAIGAISALKELGKNPGDIILTGWDGDSDTLNAIASGWVHASPILPINFMVELAFATFESLNLRVDGMSNDTTRAFARREIPKFIEVPATLITQENLADYQEIKR